MVTAPDVPWSISTNKSGARRGFLPGWPSIFNIYFYSHCHWGFPLWDAWHMAFPVMTQSSRFPERKEGFAHIITHGTYRPKHGWWWFLWLTSLRDSWDVSSPGLGQAWVSDQRSKKACLLDSRLTNTGYILLVWSPNIKHCMVFWHMKTTQLCGFFQP